MVESQRPTQNQGCQSQWKSHVFQLLRTFVHLKTCTVSSSFPPPGPFFSPYLGRGGSGVMACWGMAAPTSGFKEAQDKTCAMRCDDSFIHFLPDMHSANPEGSSGGCVCSLTGLAATESRTGHAVPWGSYGHTSSALKFKQHSDAKLLAGVIPPQAAINTIFLHKPFNPYFLCGGSHIGLFLLLLAIS